MYPGHYYYFEAPSFHSDQCLHGVQAHRLTNLQDINSDDACFTPVVFVRFKAFSGYGALIRNAAR